MLARKVFFARSAGFIIPYDLVYKVFPSEDLIHEDLPHNVQHASPGALRYILYPTADRA